MASFKPGPATIPIPETDIAALVHYKYINAMSYDDMALKIKIGKQSLERVIRDKGGVKRETHMRIMRFVKRIKNKAEKRAAIQEACDEKIID